MRVFTEASPACLFNPFKSATDKTETILLFRGSAVPALRRVARPQAVSQHIAVYSGIDLGVRKANRK